VSCKSHTPSQVSRQHIPERLHGWGRPVDADLSGDVKDRRLNRRTELPTRAAIGTKSAGSEVLDAGLDCRQLSITINNNNNNNMRPAHEILRSVFDRKRVV
jgi:hypothetical protein